MDPAFCQKGPQLQRLKVANIAKQIHMSKASYLQLGSRTLETLGFSMYGFSHILEILFFSFLTFNWTLNIYKNITLYVKQSEPRKVLKNNNTFFQYKVSVNVLEGQKIGEILNRILKWSIAGPQNLRSEDRGLWIRTWISTISVDITRNPYKGY